MERLLPHSCGYLHPLVPCFVSYPTLRSSTPGLGRGPKPSLFHTTPGPDRQEPREIDLDFSSSDSNTNHRNILPLVMVSVDTRYSTGFGLRSRNTPTDETGKCKTGFTMSSLFRRDWWDRSLGRGDIDRVVRQIKVSLANSDSYYIRSTRFLEYLKQVTIWIVTT